MHIAIGYNWFVTAAGYHIERALRALGHTVTYVGLPCAARPGYDSGIAIDEIIAGLAERPDLYLWVDPAGRYFPLGIEDSPVSTACYLIDVHLGGWRPQVARFFDAVFVAQKDSLETYRQALGHDQVYWLPLAAAPDVHCRHDLPKVYDVGFVGNIALAHRGTSRGRRLKMIAERFNTNDFYRFYPPEEVGRVYSQSRIVFNTSIAGDVTMRIFEGTASGALVLTDSVGNGLGELFEIGREIVVYQDDADLLSRIAFYLAREDERAEIAGAGWRRTQVEHTYQRRVQAILEKVGAPSFRRVAPMREAPAEVRRASRWKIYTHLHMVDAIMDEARDSGLNPLRRASATWPAIVRRWLR